MAEIRTLAAEMLQAGAAFRVSVTGEPRAPLCGMGICYECRANIAGEPHARTCQMVAVAETAAAAPRARLAEYDCELLIVGAGPAGIAAALRAAACGLRVTVADDNPAIGGQIWRGRVREPWAGRLRDAPVQWLPGLRITHAAAPNVLAAEGQCGGARLRYAKLLLATGARERFLPFPGWTLPHVTGVGGLQALVKSGLSVAGKRIIVAGTGPLLLEVAGSLRKRGATIVTVCEQAGWLDAAGNAWRMALYPAKLREALHLGWRLRGVRPRLGTWVTAAHGRDHVEGVTLSDGTHHACDYLACGYHLIPNLELAQLLGCRIAGGSVSVDGQQQTSVPGIYCAGEPTGVGGLERALLEGEIAALALAGCNAEAARLARRRPPLLRFARALERACRLRPELRQLPHAETLICRCEDVAWGRLRDQPDWRQAKLQTRCGMGACQGRVCGPALEFLAGWQLASVRPPASPASLASWLR